MTNNPLVSIITASFNSEKTIRQTIQSVLDQTYPNIEYIIIDGKSSDHTMDIVGEFEPKFNGRMKVVSERDGGIYYGLNKGVALATGELVGFVNSDDWYQNDAVEKAVEAHQKAPGKFIYGILNYIDNEKVLQVATGSHEFLPNSLIPYPTWFIPRELIQKFGEFDTKYRVAADVDLVIRYFKKGVAFYRIDHVLSNFRSGGESDKHMTRSRVEVLQSMKEHGYISENKLKVNIFLLKFALFKAKLYKTARKVITTIIPYD